MRLKFDPNLQFQIETVNAIVDVFDGQPINQGDFEISFIHDIGLLEHTVKHEDKTLYLVQETKSTKDFAQLRSDEADKLKCGHKYFNI